MGKWVVGEAGFDAGGVEEGEGAGFWGCSRKGRGGESAGVIGGGEPAVFGLGNEAREEKGLSVVGRVGEGIGGTSKSGGLSLRLVRSVPNAHWPLIRIRLANENLRHIMTNVARTREGEVVGRVKVVRAKGKVPC